MCGGACGGLVEVRTCPTQHVHPDLDVAALHFRHLPPGLVGQAVEVTHVDGDQRGVGQGEFHVPAHEFVQGLVRVAGGVGPVAAAVQQLVADSGEHFREHGVLAAEMPVQRGAGDADGGADVIDAYAVEAVPGEQLRRRGQDLLAAGDFAVVDGGFLGHRT